MRTQVDDRQRDDIAATVPARAAAAQAGEGPNLSVEERGVAFRHARNLVRINMAVAVREISETSAPNATATPKVAVPPKPTFDRKV